MFRIRPLPAWTLGAGLVLAIFPGCGPEPGDAPAGVEAAARERAVFRVPGMT